MKRISHPSIFILTPIFFIFAHWIGLLRPVENALFSALAPAQRFFYQAGVGANTQSDQKSPELLAENQRLNKEISGLKIEIAHLRENEAELNELRGLFNYFQRDPSRKVVASVIGARIIGSARTLLLDRGSDDGIKKDFPVVNQDGIMVGKIFEAKNKSSLVLILLDQRSAVAATIQNKDRTIGIVEGGHGISSSMKFIPQSEEIIPGAIVVTSGLEENIPRGLIIGTVESVIKEVREPFQEATIKPLVDFNKIINVGVILPQL